MDLQSHFRYRKLEDHVENRTRYAVDDAELNIFETHKAAEEVALQFSFPIIATMLAGKKVMKINDEPVFDFFPGESVLVSSQSKLLIDFPEATVKNPTRCLALAIESEKIQKVIADFNDRTYLDKNSKEWSIQNVSSALINESSIHDVIERMVKIFTEDHSSKDVFADFLIKELIIRLLQSESRKILITEISGNRMAHIVQYINDHLSENISIDQLSKRAEMSKSHFFRCFKNTFGQSPVEFINQSRVKKAKELLAKTTLSMDEISGVCGYNNISYFIRQFKQQEQITPYQFKKQFQA